jgi:MFS family permease
MTVGPLVAAAGLVLTLRIGPYASYLTDVLPGVVVFGLGLSLLVAPLTAAVLAAAPEEHAGAASGVNNAVARTAGLLAVALLPPLAGLTGDVYRDPAAFEAGYRTATLLAAGLLVVGGLLSAALVRNDAGRIDPGVQDGDDDVEHCYSCPVDGPRLETVRPTRAERS